MTGKKTAKKKPIPFAMAKKFLQSLVFYFEGFTSKDDTRLAKGDVLNVIAKIQYMLKEQKNKRDHYIVMSMAISGQNNQTGSSNSRLSYAQALASPSGTIHTYITSVAAPKKTLLVAKEIRIRVSNKVFSDSLYKKNKSSEHIIAILNSVITKSRNINNSAWSTALGKQINSIRLLNSGDIYIYAANE